MPEAALSVFGALYRAMGGACVALGLVSALLALFGISQGILWAMGALVLPAGVAGFVATLGPRHVEEQTGVQTP